MVAGRDQYFLKLVSKAQLVPFFDLWDTDSSRKEAVLRRLAEGWNEHLQADKIFKWFKDQDEREKCSLAWSGLEKNKPVLTRREKPFARYDELLEFSTTVTHRPARKSSTWRKLKDAGAPRNRAIMPPKRNSTTLYLPTMSTPPLISLPMSISYLGQNS